MRAAASRLLPKARTPDLTQAARRKAERQGDEIDPQSVLRFGFCRYNIPRWRWAHAGWPTPRDAWSCFE